VIRPASLQDVNVILGVASVLSKQYPLRADRSKMNSVIVEMISNPSDFAIVDEVNGRIRAVLLAFVGDNLWAERKFANVALWWSNKPGSGIALLRRFKEWVTSRRAIRIAGFAPDIDLDPRVYAIMERLGFEKAGGAYLLVNGVKHGIL
jgi:hypothetical protein